MRMLITTFALSLLAGGVLAQTAPTTPRAEDPKAQDPVADLLRDTDPATGELSRPVDPTAAPAALYDPDGETPRDPYDPELQVTAGLNAEIAARDRDLEAENLRTEAQHQAQLEAMAAEQARGHADYAAAQAAHQQALARQAMDHQAAMDAWRRCAAGDRASCAPQPMRK